MTQKMPPVPKANRSPKGTGSDPDTKKLATEKAQEAKNDYQTGRPGQRPAEYFQRAGQTVATARDGLSPICRLPPFRTKVPLVAWRRLQAFCFGVSE